MQGRLKWQLAQWLEIRWWKNYLSDKSPEDYLNWKTSYWQKFLVQLNELLEQQGWKPIDLGGDTAVMDAGCGPAGVFTILKEAKLTAIDPLLKQYEELPHFKPSHYPNVSFKPSAIEQLNHPSEFDVAFCLNAINHVSDLKLSLLKLHETIKPGGLLVLTTDCHVHNALKHLFRLIPGDALHPHQYDEEEYERLIAKAGFQKLISSDLRKGRVFNYRLIVALRK